MTDLRTTCRVCGIQHFAPIPGYGLRTVVFLSGCPLHCKWCCNPEAVLPHPVVACNSDKCLGPAVCDHCLTSCSCKAIYVNRTEIGLARDICTNCGECVARCPSGALFLSSREMSLQDVVDHVVKDEGYIAATGGITLSGGEPLMHPDKAAALLEVFKGRGLGTLVETCGFFDIDARATIASLRATDVLFFDIKHSDPRRHRMFTGVDNSRILHNFAMLPKMFPGLDVVSRTLVVPGFNDSAETMRDIARLVSRTRSHLHILTSYSPICQDKYAQLGIPFAYAPDVVSSERLREFADVFQKEDVTVEIM